MLYEKTAWRYVHFQVPVTGEILRITCGAFVSPVWIHSRTGRPYGDLT